MYFLVRKHTTDFGPGIDTELLSSEQELYIGMTDIFIAFSVIYFLFALILIYNLSLRVKYFFYTGENLFKREEWERVEPLLQDGNAKVMLAAAAVSSCTFLEAIIVFITSVIHQAVWLFFTIYSRAPFLVEQTSDVFPEFILTVTRAAFIITLGSLIFGTALALIILFRSIAYRGIWARGFELLDLARLLIYGLWAWISYQLAWLVLQDLYPWLLGVPGYPVIIYRIFFALIIWSPALAIDWLVSGMTPVNALLSIEAMAVVTALYISLMAWVHLGVPAESSLLPALLVPTLLSGLLTYKLLAELDVELWKSPGGGLLCLGRL